MSRGTINGDVLNTFALNEGQVTHEASAVAAMALGATCRASQKHSARAAMTGALNHTAQARRRQLFTANAALAVGATALARRRIGLESSSSLALAHVAAATRRAQFAASDRIDLSGGATLFWRYRQRAPRERVLIVPLDQPGRIFTSRGP